MNDDGYSYAEFCNLYHYNHVPLFHFIGGHKRRPRVCELIAKTLLDRYPEYYRRIVELFPGENKRMQEGTPRLSTPSLSVQACIARYQDFLCDRMAEWRAIGKEDLYQWEKRLAAYPRFLEAKAEEQSKFILGRNPHLSIFSMYPWIIPWCL